MFDGIFDLIYGIVVGLANKSVILIDRIFENYATGGNLNEIVINLSLFSETPIFTLNLYDILLLFFVIFYSMFFVVLLYKVSKKIIMKVFGVFRI